MRAVAFHQLAFEQYNEWATSDKKIFERVGRLITETAKTHSPVSVNPNHSKEA
jgi:Txe/YoeB family toxin of Txe-Axe toxin-antitoxin module